MSQFTKPGVSPNDARRAEIVRVQEELEALDRMADAVDSALYPLLDLVKLASTNPVKFRSVLAIGCEAADTLTAQRAIIRSEINRLDACLTEITRQHGGLSTLAVLAEGWSNEYTTDEMRANNAREKRAAQENEIINRGVSAGLKSTDILAQIAELGDTARPVLVDDSLVTPGILAELEVSK